jgi:hypothetical protein
MAHSPPGRGQLKLAFEYRFAFTPEDHYRSTQEVTGRSGLRRLLRGFILAGPLVMVAISLAGGSSLPAALVAHAIWFVMAPLFVFVVLPLLEQWQIRRFYRSSPAAGGEQSFIIDDVGLHMSSALSNFNLRWEAMTEVVEAKGFFLFYIAKEYAYFLPAAVVGNEDEKAQLRAFIAAHVPGRTRFAGARSRAAS